MKDNTEVQEDLRDGKETFPEQGDLPTFPRHQEVDHSDNPDLDEALRETFPASDPIASGRME